MNNNGSSFADYSQRNNNNNFYLNKNNRGITSFNEPLSRTASKVPDVNHRAEDKGDDSHSLGSERISLISIQQKAKELFSDHPILATGAALLAVGTAGLACYAYFGQGAVPINPNTSHILLNLSPTITGEGENIADSAFENLQWIGGDFLRGHYIDTEWSIGQLAQHHSIVAFEGFQQLAALGREIAEVAGSNLAPLGSAFVRSMTEFSKVSGPVVGQFAKDCGILAFEGLKSLTTQTIEVTSVVGPVFFNLAKLEFAQTIQEYTGLIQEIFEDGPSMAWSIGQFVYDSSGSVFEGIGDFATWGAVEVANVATSTFGYLGELVGSSTTSVSQGVWAGVELTQDYSIVAFESLQGLVALGGEVVDVASSNLATAELAFVRGVAEAGKVAVPAVSQFIYDHSILAFESLQRLASFGGEITDVARSNLATAELAFVRGVAEAGKVAVPAVSQFIYDHSILAFESLQGLALLAGEVVDATRSNLAAAELAFVRGAVETGKVVVPAVGQFAQDYSVLAFESLQGLAALGGEVADLVGSKMATAELASIQAVIILGKGALSAFGKLPSAESVVHSSYNLIASTIDLTKTIGQSIPERAWQAVAFIVVAKIGVSGVLKAIKMRSRSSLASAVSNTMSDQLEKINRQVSRQGGKFHDPIIRPKGDVVDFNYDPEVETWIMQFLGQQDVLEKLLQRVNEGSACLMALDYHDLRNYLENQILDPAFQTRYNALLNEMNNEELVQLMNFTLTKRGIVSTFSYRPSEITEVGNDMEMAQGWIVNQLPELLDAYSSRFNWDEHDRYITQYDYALLKSVVSRRSQDILTNNEVVGALLDSMSIDGLWDLIERAKDNSSQWAQGATWTRPDLNITHAQVITESKEIDLALICVAKRTGFLQSPILTQERKDSYVEYLRQMNVDLNITDDILLEIANAASVYFPNVQKKYWLEEVVVEDFSEKIATAMLNGDVSEDFLDGLLVEYRAIQQILGQLIEARDENYAAIEELSDAQLKKICCLAMGVKVINQIPQAMSDPYDNEIDYDFYMQYSVASGDFRTALRGLFGPDDRWMIDELSGLQLQVLHEKGRGLMGQLARHHQIVIESEELDLVVICIANKMGLLQDPILTPNKLNQFRDLLDKFHLDSLSEDRLRDFANTASLYYPDLERMYWIEENLIEECVTGIKEARSDHRIDASFFSDNPVTDGGLRDALQGIISDPILNELSDDQLRQIRSGCGA